MAGDDQSDPFLWEEDRVVQELCTANRSWKAPAAKRLPDPVALEAKLRECGVDGQSLLTYEDEFGFDQLWAALGVKKLPHQLSLKDAITQLRRRSKKYREWKAQQLAASQLLDEEEHDSAVKSHPYEPADLEHVGQAAPVSQPDHDNATPHPGAPVPGLAIPFQGVLSPTLSASVDRDLPTSQVLQTAQENTEEPPSKKRRIAPTNISNNTTGNSAFAIIPTEGDVVLRADLLSRDPVETILQEDESSGFLGPGILRPAQLFEPELLDAADLAEQDFVLLPRQLPAGRRIQVSAAMKRFLRASLADRLRMSAHGREEESEYGPSDDESVDSETWREYQQEEAERAAMEAGKDADNERLLSKEEVAEAVRTAIQELETRWLIEKKPKYDLKALKTWQDARRNPNRVAFIESAKRELDHFASRIALYSKHIVDQPWTVKNDVQRKASGILEASVFDKKRQAWLIDVVESPVRPPKPSTLPRPTPKRAEPSVVVDDEEVLTSDSDDLGSFIENDDDIAPIIHEEMDIDSEPPEQQVPATASSDSTATGSPGSRAGARSSAARVLSSEQQANNDLTSTVPAPRKAKSEPLSVPATPHRTRISAPEIIEIESSPSPTKQLLEVPGLDDLDSLEKIGEIGIEYWQKNEDPKRLVVAVLCDWSDTKRKMVYEVIKDHDHPEIWAKYIAPVLDTREDLSSAAAGLETFLICRLFDAYVSKSAKRSFSSVLRTITCNRIKREGNLFASFCALLRRILPIFLRLVPQTPTQGVPQTPRNREQRSQTPAEAQESPDNPSASEESSSDDHTVPSTKKRRRVKRRDAQAAKVRSDVLKRNEELARRTRELRERLAQQGPDSNKHTRLIVNETKESDDQALIYINDHIGSKIKDHQIEGVRFMWNQLVVESSVRQGCLLAHTMGLGKTMQVITLLVVIAESSASPDESVRSQIPEDLRESKTLILCPPSLLDNWHEEIHMWAPNGILGPVYKMDSVIPASERMEMIQAWASSGGILILGYSMFTTLVKGTEGAGKLLLETPNIVVGDEAHYMKNPGSQRHQATANFRTMSRIAMTGSPLTNNVMDYYAMINWVAPNYLADIAEFRERYSNPIKEGLYADSEPSKKRKARKMLHVLKATVDPKVHRRDIEVLLNELPKKKEFIITLPLTKAQKRLYRRYIECVMEPNKQLMTGQAKAWSLVAKLGLVLAHPIIFKTVAESQKAEARKATAGGYKAQSPSSSSTTSATEQDDEDNIELPQDVLSQLLTTVALRDIEDYALSNKILVLLRILDECKKVGDKVLVFSQSIPTLNYIETIFKRQRVVYQRLDGATPMSKRQDLVKKFNTDSETRVYLISTRAGGVGLNMYGANRVVIFDFRYTPAEEQQAIGRAYRLGQTKPVYVYWLTIGGTFEDTIHNNAVFKTQLASRVVDKKNPDPWSSRFSEYFMMPREVEQEDLSGSLGQDKVLDALVQCEQTGKLIRKITSTETFEREETYELTPEEQQEAEKDIEMERLRLQNPEEFRRREQERLLQSRGMLGMQSQPPPDSYQPRPTDGESPSMSSDTDSRSNRIVKIKVPEHLRKTRNSEPPVTNVVSDVMSAQAQRNPSSCQKVDSHHQQQVLTLASAATVNRPIPTTTQQASHVAIASEQTVSVHENPPSTHPTSAASTTAPDTVLTQDSKAAPQPILAAGSHFKVQQAPPPPVPTSEPPLVGNLGTPSPTPTAVSEVDFPDLLTVHSTLCQEGRHVRHHPSDVISRVQAVWVREKIEKLPMMDKIQNVKRFSRNPRFAEAMLSGYMDPEQLASMTRLEMDEISTTLNSLSEAEFRQRVWTTKADLNVCNTDTKSA
ncbi:hypothetical protein MYCTH_2304143 [Thermothelomyces thermophilus ATCC 42464]|uniref:Uncharacterized protein n=1 Tax=Thermothelomyces thermophilus (strain ATCC 42464 / BCRC 31852 / DSM 1799) TaxID=573729 RepID=G2QEA6_THET4|nr:uncharacterized protein MYCTH_2304143 [Thermothelomyces thermophilus ATCC 42464]AEO57689.1 hypothetical protein MYCTH_2304143 [Thermothelomyces thermophilus ATCC 42464]